jgi:hypothetical protein
MEVNMKNIRVYFLNGDKLETNINGSVEEIINYYLGRKFTLEVGDEEVTTSAIRIKFFAEDGNYFEVSASPEHISNL